MACAIAAHQNGLDYLVLEKGALVNSLYHYPLYMTFFSTAERLEIGNVPFSCIAPKPGRQEALEYYRNIQKHFKLNINFYERAEGVQKNDHGHFAVQTPKAVYTAENVVIATGFYDIPMYMDVPGENLPHVRHYYKEAHEYAFKKVVVIGANNSSVDAALECWHKGADVTMVIRKGEINDRVKYWIKPDIENRIAEGSIKAHFYSEVTAIREGDIDITTPEGPVTLEADFVLALTGYRPDIEFLQKAGVQISGVHCIPQYNPETMETNVSGLYLAGVVCGGLETHKWFIENSRVHADMIVKDIISV